jgi:hypothetical protein
MESRDILDMTLQDNKILLYSTAEGDTDSLLYVPAAL